MNGATDLLPQSFVVLTQPLPPPAPPPTAVSPHPVVATSQNLPYTLSITPVSTARTPLLPGVQAAVYALIGADGGLSRWAVALFRRPDQRIAQLHTQRRDQLPGRLPERRHHRHQSRELANLVAPLEPDRRARVRLQLAELGRAGFYQKGDTLYTIGGYSVPDSINFTGDTTDGSTTVGVSNIAGLAVGQYVPARESRSFCRTRRPRPT